MFFSMLVFARKVGHAWFVEAGARALVQLGREQEGLARIEAVGHGWALAPRHVQASAERWRARALDVLGREAAAQEARARSRRIAQEGKQSASFCDALCRIDAALHERDEAAAGAFHLPLALADLRRPLADDRRGRCHARGGGRLLCAAAVGVARAVYRRAEVKGEHAAPRIKVVYEALDNRQGINPVHGPKR